MVIFLVQSSDGWGHSIPVRVFSTYMKAVKWCQENGGAMNVKIEGGGADKSWWVPYANRSGGYAISNFWLDSQDPL